MKTSNINKIHSFDVGFTFTTKNGLECEIIKILDSRFCIIRFAESGNVQKITMNPTAMKMVTDYSVDKIWGVGYAFGTVETPFSPKGEIYKHWSSIIYRCYANKKNCYRDVTVSKEWQNFYCFEKWYKDNMLPAKERFALFKDELCIDKDLFSVDNEKTYSSETCCALPRSINSALRLVKWENGNVIGMTKLKHTTLTNLLATYRTLLSERIIRQLEEILNKALD